MQGMFAISFIFHELLYVVFPVGGLGTRERYLKNPAYVMRKIYAARDESKGIKRLTESPSPSLPADFSL